MRRFAAASTPEPSPRMVIFRPSSRWVHESPDPPQVPSSRMVKLVFDPWPMPRQMIRSPGYTTRSVWAPRISPVSTLSRSRSGPVLVTSTVTAFPVPPRMVTSPTRL